MSCLPQTTWTRWLAGELTPEEHRRAELHLVGCETCRARVVALREVRGLAAVPVDSGRAATSPPAAEAVGSGRASRIRLLGVAAGLAVLALLGLWLEDQIAGSLGADLGTLAPRSLASAVLDFILLLQRRAPGLFALVLAVAAMAGVSALATFALTALLRRMDRGHAVLLALGLGLAATDPALAFELRREDSVHVTADERIEGTLIAAGDEVVVEGTVAGDLVAAGERVRVRGRVEGNVYAFADEVEIDGAVAGSVYAAAGALRLASAVDGSVYLAGERVRIAEAARVHRDVWLLAERAELRGQFGRDVSAFAEHFAFAGEAGRDLAVHADEARLAASARIGGDLLIELPPGRSAELAGASVAGETRLSERSRPPRDRLGQLAQTGFWLWLAVRLAAAFVSGMVLWWLLPGLFRLRFSSRNDLARSLGIGLLTTLAVPPLLALLAVTLIGLPLAIAGSFLLIAALYVGGLLVAARVGAALLAGDTGGWRSFGLVLLTGLLVLGAASILPFFGPLVRVLSALVGLGLLVEAGRARRSALSA